MLRSVLSLISALCLASAQEPLRFELTRVERKTAACVATFEYPKIISAASPQTRDRINAGILRVLLRQTAWPAKDSHAASIDAYAEASMNYCAEFQKGPQPRNLYEHKLVTILRYTPPVLSFRCDADQDTGGAHPFGTTFFVNFDSTTGQQIGLSSLIKDGDLPELQSIAESTFRREHQLSPAENLAEHGYQFPGGRFQLNDNFGIGETNLVFVFNTYEIGPGVMGQTTIQLPYGQIRKLLKTNIWAR